MGFRVIPPSGGSPEPTNRSNPRFCTTSRSRISRYPSGTSKPFGSLRLRAIPRNRTLRVEAGQNPRSGSTFRRRAGTGSDALPANQVRFTLTPTPSDLLDRKAGTERDAVTVVHALFESSSSAASTPPRSVPPASFGAMGPSPPLRAGAPAGCVPGSAATHLPLTLPSWVPAAPIPCTRTKKSDPAGSLNPSVGNPRAIHGGTVILPAVSRQERRQACAERLLQRVPRRVLARVQVEG